MDLGDTVRAHKEDGQKPVFQVVIEASGHYTLRALVEPPAVAHVVAEVERLGGRIEREEGTGLIAIDAPSEEVAGDIYDRLSEFASDGALVFDTGWH